VSDIYASVLAVALVVWTMLAFSLDRRLFYAVLLHNVAWIAALAIVGSGVMNFTPLSPFAWTVLTGALIAFNMGVALARGRPGRAVGGTLPNRAGAAPLTSFGMYLLLLAGFTAGLAVYLWTVASYYGLDVLVSDPSSIRAYSEDDPGYLQLFPLYGKVLFYLGPLCFLLTVLPDLVRGLRNKPASFRYSVALFLLVAQAATLQRTNIFVSVGMVLGVVLLRAGSGNTPVRKVPAARRLGGMLALAAVGVVAFQGIAVALGKTGSEDAEVTYSVDPSIRDTPLVGIFQYATSGIPAFGNLVDSRDERWPDPSDLGNAYGDFNPQTWGKATLAAPLKLVPGIDQRWQEIAPFTAIPSKTNVYTWLEPWYRDFRAPGAILGALTIGLLVGSAARMAGRSPRALVLGGVLVGFSGLATFVNRYGAVMSIILYLIIWWLGRPRRETAGEGTTLAGDGSEHATVLVGDSGRNAGRAGLEGHDHER
jgi:oligosaccharide repeat unit polymerase